ncbi:MAG: site-specific DNA-methyltransferase [Nostoc sp.]
MNREDIEKVEKASSNINTEQIKQLKAIFPEVFTEGKVDFAKLKAILEDTVDDRPERYSFTWAGKREAIQMLQTPSRATLKPDRSESVDFDTTQNMFIEGDNLEVLKLLRKYYSGQVKMIYIDPPYNTGNDFIYPDNYTDALDNYLQITGQKDSEGNLQTSNPETSGRYHSAWLSMMYPRLFLARQLLREDGVIFVSIDDHEVHNLRLLMNEVFGEENFVANIVWQKRTSPDARATIGKAHDSILVFSRSLESFKSVFRLLPLSEDRSLDYKNIDNDPKGAWASVDLSGQTGHATSSQFYTIITPTGVEYLPPQGRCWAIAKTAFEKLAKEGCIWFGKDGNARPRLKRYLSEAKGMATWTWWTNQEVGHNQEATQELNELMQVGEVFDTPKPTRLIKRMLMISTTPCLNEIVLDFFAGSATTAQAILELNHQDGGNRKFILVQLPQKTDNPQFPTIADIGKERIRRSIQKIKDSENGKLPLQNRETPEDLGLKVLKLSKSNYRQWKELTSDTEPEQYIEQLELFNDPLLDGWKPEDVIYEVLLKEGYCLTSRIDIVPEIEPATIWKVTDEDKGQHFYISLDNQFYFETARTLKLTKNDLLICRDMAIDDTTAANLVLQCRLKTI